MLKVKVLSKHFMQPHSKAMVKEIFNHMEKFKKIITGVGIASLLLVWWGWDARSDYTWSKLVIEEKQQEGWVVGATQANLVDITHPWTIFKQPIVRIAFVKPNDFGQLDNGMVFTKVLWVDYANMSRTEEEVFQDIYDCRNNKTAFVDDEVSISELDPSKLEWRENANTSNVDIAKVVCR